MHIIWEALNCLLSVMFECQVSLCQWLVNSNQPSCQLPSSNKWPLLPYICAKMMVWKKKKKKKNFFFFVFSHPGGSVSLLGVRELGCISGRLLDDPGGFTCMLLFWANMYSVVKVPFSWFFRRLRWDFSGPSKEVWTFGLLASCSQLMASCSKNFLGNQQMLKHNPYIDCEILYVVCK